MIWKTGSNKWRLAMTNAIHAERFAALFKGYSKAFGTYDARTLGGERKQKTQRNESVQKEKE